MSAFAEIEREFIIDSITDYPGSTTAQVRDGPEVFSKAANQKVSIDSVEPVKGITKIITPCRPTLF